MKYLYHFLLAALFVFAAVRSGNQCVYAELIQDNYFNVQENVVDVFNNLNNRVYSEYPGRTSPGFHFENLARDYLGTIPLQNYRDHEPADLSAYNSNIMTTFCVQPGVRVGAATYYVGRLNYESDGYSYVTNEQGGLGNVLNIGAAFFYKEFVLGNWDDMIAADFDNDAHRFELEAGDVIRFLMGYSVTGDYIDWNHPLLDWLWRRQAELTGKDISVFEVYGKIINYFLETPYKPDAYYEEIGDYSVFVMDVYLGNGDVSQDFIYIAKVNGVPHLPEPATILLWTLGTAGAFGYARKRSGKKSTVA